MRQLSTKGKMDITAVLTLKHVYSSLAGFLLVSSNNQQHHTKECVVVVVLDEYEGNGMYSSSSEDLHCSTFFLMSECYTCKQSDVCHFKSTVLAVDNSEFHVTVG